MSYGPNRNPNKGATIEPLSKVVVVVITHLPEMESEYGKTRFQAIYKSLTSLFINSVYAGTLYDFIIWDNGSHKDFQYWLQSLGYANTLILSRNIGKTNALKFILQGLPPDTIVAYGDDDIEYFPNWLEPQIKILQTFPHVGVVSGMLSATDATYAVEKTLWWAARKALNVEEFVIPEEYEKDFGDSIGAPNWLDKNLGATWKITYNGVSALVGAKHCQFVGYAGRLAPYAEWSNLAMPPERPFDERLDKAGYLRLSTVERVTRHIGNRLETVKE